MAGEADQNAGWYRQGVLDMFTSNMPKVNEYGVEEPLKNFPRGPSPSPAPPNVVPTAPLPPFVQTSPVASGPAGFYGSSPSSSMAKAPIPKTMIAAGVGAVALLGLVAWKLSKKRR